jgi:hypothetical protein
MARKLTIRLAPARGTIERFYAFVDGHKRIADDGTHPREWSGEVKDTVCIKVRTFGIGQARYSLQIDLPGALEDQRLELQLDDGYGELELSV